jgi:mono/diheme cytochrome c family protein
VTGGEGHEVIRSFENGWSGMPPFGMAIAGDEAGDVVLDEV